MVRNGDCLCLYPVIIWLLVNSQRRERWRIGWSWLRLTEERVQPSIKNRSDNDSLIGLETDLVFAGKTLEIFSSVNNIKEDYNPIIRVWFESKSLISKLSTLFPVTTGWLVTREMVTFLFGVGKNNVYKMDPTLFITWPRVWSGLSDLFPRNLFLSLLKFNFYGGMIKLWLLVTFKTTNILQTLKISAPKRALE